MNRLAIIACAFAALLGGCGDFGEGGSGEIVVPQRTLREIDAVEMRDLPTTNPTTQATSQPAAKEIRLRIEDVRREVLANNLDLKVELLNPTIAREALSEEQARFEAL